MKWVEVLTPIVGHVVWPSAVVILAVLFRRPLRGLLGRLNTAEAPGGVRLSFSEAIAQAEESTDRAVEAIESPELGDKGEAQSESERELTTKEVLDELIHLSDSSDPSGIMLGAWREVEAALKRLWVVNRHRLWPTNPDDTHRSPFIGARVFAPLPTAMVMREVGIISNEMAIAIGYMKAARDAIAHDGAEPTPGQAESYAESALELARALWVLANLVPGSGQDDAR